MTLAGSGVNDDDFDTGAASIVGSAGYFVSDELQVGIRQSVTFSDSGLTGGEAWNGASRGFLDYHFPLETVVPFVGANFGYVYGDSVNETFAAAPEAGVKVYLKPEAFLIGMAEYQFFFEDADDLDDQFDNGQFAYTLGFGLVF